MARFVPEADRVLASDKCQAEKRKTVNGEDIIFAMQSLGFENYGEAARIYLARYREVSAGSTCSPSTFPSLFQGEDTLPGTAS